MRIVCTGSRNWIDELAIRVRFRALPRTAHIIVGEAKGADRMVALEALRRGLRLTIVEADWDAHGKAAGPIRNRAMLDLNPALVLAFWRARSPGTGDTIREAQKRGIPTEIHWRA